MKTTASAPARARARFTRRTLLAAAALLAASGPALAQSRDLALKDIAKVSIVVEDVAPNASVCGVTKQAMRDSFVARLQGSPLTVIGPETAKDDPEATTVYVKATVMPLDIPNGPCITHLDVKLYDLQKVVLLATKRETFGTVELWEKGAMLATDREHHGQAVYDSVAEKASDLVAAWKLDNPGK